MSTPSHADAVCRAAEGADRRLARMLLPEVGAKAELSSYTLIAARSGTPVFGAAAHGPVIEATGARALQVALRIAKPFRRCGLGSMLLDHVASVARADGAGAILVAVDATAEPHAAAALARRGYVVANRLSHFEGEHAVLAAYLRELRDWLIGRGMVPAGARMVPLREAPLPWVARLHSESLGGTVARNLAGLEARLARPSADDNAVLVVDGRFVGFCLGETIDGVTTLDAEAIDPAYRGDLASSGWANVFMLGERTDWALVRGSRLVRFSSRDSTGPTMKLARRAGARVVHVEEFWRALLTPAGG